MVKQGTLAGGLEGVDLKTVKTGLMRDGDKILLVTSEVMKEDSNGIWIGYYDVTDLLGQVPPWLRNMQGKS